MTDGKSIVTSTEGTTGTGCSGTGKTCTGPFTQEAECTAAEICATKTVSETCNGTLYRPGVSSGPYDTTNTCPKCGKSSKSCYIKCYSCSYSAYTVNCTNGSCGYTWNPKQGEHKKSVTLCIKHGKSNSHYYCAEHDQICSTTTHTITENVQCEHGKTSQHSCCDHGNTSLHFPN